MSSAEGCGGRAPLLDHAGEIIEPGDVVELLDEKGTKLGFTGTVLQFGSVNSAFIPPGSVIALQLGASQRTAQPADQRIAPAHCWLIAEKNRLSQLRLLTPEQLAAKARQAQWLLDDCFEALREKEFQPVVDGKPFNWNAPRFLRFRKTTLTDI